MISSTQSEGHSFYSREVSRLSADRASRGNKDGPNGPAVNDMILSLLLQINEDSSVKGKQASELDDALVSKLKEHSTKLEQRTQQITKQIASMEQEDARKITSEGLREGFSSGHISKAEREEEEEQQKAKSAKAKPEKKSSSTTYETLNSPSSSNALTAGQSADSDAEEDEDVPDLTPMMKAFGLLPPCIPKVIPLTAESLPAAFTTKLLDGSTFSAALDFLSSHKQLLRPQANTTDAMLVEAFQSQMRGEAARARQFVEKALMVQYLGKLGSDGVNLFFRRMASPDGKAVTVFFNDVLSTYVRIAKRCEALAKEGTSSDGQGQTSGGQEQIQLVAEDPSTVISFDVPDGPAPEQIELEGEAAEKLDVEQVREFLNHRWAIFSGFDTVLQEALKTKQLDKVNEVLGSMPVEKAEEVVGLLDQAGILNFSSAEVRDETGKGSA